MMLNYVKQQWQIFSDREKRLVIVGSSIVAVLFVYFVMWCPLSDGVDQYKTQFQSQKKLLIYLQNASQQIQWIKASGIQINEHEHGNLFALVERTLSQEKLTPYLKQVQQPHQNQITLTFHHVPFQPLMQWLQKLIATQGIKIENFKVRRSSTSGTVSATISL